MKFPGVLFVLFLCLMNSRCAPLRQSELEQPNVVLIVADDLGYGDLAVYGGKRWAHLIRRVYHVEPSICQKCGGTMRVVAFITQP